MASPGSVHIPKFGDWKTDGGSTPYTMYFEGARKQKSMGSTGTAMPPPSEPPLAHGKSLPPNHRANDTNPTRSRDPAHRRRSQSTAGSGGGSVPAWGQWNERSGGAQQYTLVFDQIREERRSAPSTPEIAQPQQYHDQRDHEPKRVTCFGLCWS